MVLVRLLERKDSASLIVAIAGGVIIGFQVAGLATSLSSWLLDTRGDFGMSFKTEVLMPLLTLVLAFVLLEGLARAVIAGRAAMNKR